MRPKNRRRILRLGLASILLSGCDLTPEYIRPESPVPAFLTAEDASGRTPPRSGRFESGWREFFRDESLKTLIARSLEHNHDLRLAVLQAAEAKALYGIQETERYPEADAQAAATLRDRLRGGNSSNSAELSLGAAFEPDLFGRLKNLSESALQSYLATEEARKAVQIALVSQVAQSYFAHTLAKERLHLATRTLKSWQHSMSFIEGRIQSGQSSLLDLEQARSLTEAASAAVAERRREVTQTRNALHLLTGAYDETALPATSLMAVALSELPDRLSSGVLLGRPDVMEAEHALKAANADIGAARAAFFPSISLTGSVGVMSTELSSLFSGVSSFRSFLPQMTVPIFDGGRNRTALELAEIRKESSVVAYEKTIQTAFREVADSLLVRQSYADQMKAQQRYLTSQRQVLALAMNRYAGGAVSYLEVLDAQRTLFQAEQDVLILRKDQLVNDVALFAALGGGLNETTSPALLSPSHPE